MRLLGGCGRPEREAQPDTRRVSRRSSGGELWRGGDWKLRSLGSSEQFMVTRTAACSPCARGSGRAGGELAAARRAAAAGGGGQGSGRGGVRRRTTRSGALHHAVGAVVVALAGGDSVSAHKERGERLATTQS